MNNFISKLSRKFSDPGADPRSAILFLWGATIVVIIITFIAVFYKVRYAPQTLALHYNVIIGVDALGARARLYQVPVTALVIAGINFGLIKLLRLRQNFLPMLLAAISLLCALILLAATLFLYQVN